MANNNLTDDELAIFFAVAATQPKPGLPDDLTARVLADAAEIGADYVVPVVSVAKSQNRFARFFAPVGGVGGAFALGCFAGVGLFVGLGDMETLYSLPVMGDILLAFADDPAGSPFETLQYLMAES